MFSKELESLIQATLEDGILEEYEKAALVKRATAEGVDLAELEIYINSILQKRKRELGERLETEQKILDQKKKEAIGPVCPKCGRQVAPMTLVCECGYEFTKKESVSSVQKLFDKLNNIQLTDAELSSCQKSVRDIKSGEAVKDKNGNVQKDTDEKLYNKLIEKKKLEIISSFPVPNTKEDIIEFLSMATPNLVKKGGLWGTLSGRWIILASILVVLVSLVFIMVEDTGGAYAINFFVLFFGIGGGAIIATETDTETLLWNKRAQVWRAKFDQVLMKGRSLRGDADFTQQLNYYEQQVASKK